jgi:glucose-6-phosphate 1-dehydrogenase
MQKSPVIITLFGVTGDLSQKKLLPALFDLFSQNDFNRPFMLIGYGRRQWQQEQFITFVRESLQSNHDVSLNYDSFLDHVYYQEGSFDHVSGFNHLAKKITDLEAGFGSPALRLYYLATAPEFFEPLTHYLKEAELHQSPDSELPRLIIEKPFGTNLASAKDLNSALQAVFNEEQIYRIDHYLGKPIVQELPTIPQLNPLVQKNWTNDAIDHIQITLAESVGIGSRGAYYDATGALRDMIQNHGLALLAQLLADSSRQIIIESLTVNDYVLGQYDGYTAEANVAPKSFTDTFAAIKLTLNTDLWHNLPIYIRAGKKLKQKASTIAIKFKSSFLPPTDTLMISIEPKADIQPKMLELARLRAINPYANLLADSINSRRTFFIGDKEVEASWQALDPIIKQLNKQPPQTYQPGTWGPESSSSLIEKDNRKWL